MATDPLQEAATNLHTAVVRFQVRADDPGYDSLYVMHNTHQDFPWLVSDHVEEAPPDKEGWIAVRVEYRSHITNRAGLYPWWMKM